MNDAARSPRDLEPDEYDEFHASEADDSDILAGIWNGWMGSSFNTDHAPEAPVDRVARFKDRLRQGARERGSRYDE
jgi:hypothetical protein